MQVFSRLIMIVFGMKATYCWKNYLLDYFWFTDAYRDSGNLIATRKIEIRYDELAEPVYLYRDSLGNVLDSLS